MDTQQIPAHLHALLAAECAAEAEGTLTEADDLRQAVRLRWLERVRTEGPPTAPAAWLRAAVRAEVRPVRRRAHREVPFGGPPGPAPGDPVHRRIVAVDGQGDPATVVEAPLLAAERRRALCAAINRLPGRCPLVLTALLADGSRTYREIADELGISQGTIGPLRSRCLACLRRMLSAEVVAPRLRGMVREETGVTGPPGTGAAPSPRAPSR